MNEPTESNHRETIELTPIGHVEREPGDETLRGDELRQRPARIVIDPSFTEALLGLEAGSDILVLCYFDRADREVLQVHPRGDKDAALRGVFATRSPVRPNPIAVTSARIKSVEDHALSVVGLDALDETPVLDIKSYAESFDRPYRK